MKEMQIILGAVLAFSPVWASFLVIGITHGWGFMAAFIAGVAALVGIIFLGIFLILRGME